MKYFLLIIFSFLILASSFSQTTDSHFVEYQDSAMIDHYLSHDVFMGGGAAFFDYDNDGDDDIYITSGLNIDHFYENNGDGTFTNKNIDVGLSATADAYTHGVVVGDIDNDGFKDVFVTTKQSSLDGSLAKNFLFKNNGDNTFTDIWNHTQEKDKVFSISAVFTDYNLDGLLDIYVINYVETPQFTMDGNGVIDGFAHECFANTFYKNIGNGIFVEVSSSIGMDDDGCALAVASTDFDMDGDMDIYLANDFGEFLQTNHLYENHHIDDDYYFNEMSAAVNADIGMYAMGIAVGDIDRDLDLDYYITNFGKNAFLQNDGDHFTNITDLTTTGNEWVIQDSLLSISWGTAFLDVDNDSDLDLYVANGYVPSPSFLPSTIHMNDKLYINYGNLNFVDTDTTYGIKNEYVSRGMAYSDYDNDGDLDILTVVLNAPINGTGWKTLLYRNEKGNEKNWLQINLEGVDVNRDAYGSKIFVHVGNQILLEEVSGGSSHCSHNSSRIHFGLDTMQMVDSVEVVWTGGTRRQTVYNIAANQVIHILEDTTLAQIEINPIDTITIGIVELEKLTPFMSIFPNPTQSVVNVILKNKKNEGDLFLYDILGRLVKTMPIERHQESASFDLGKMENGIYFLVFKSEGVILTEKIVVE